MDVIAHLKNLASQYPVLPKQEQLDLLRNAKAGDIEARNQLVLHNLSYLISLAERYWWSQTSREDLVMSGIVATYEAIDKYSFEKAHENGDAGFLSYADKLIRRAMREEDEKRRNVSFPLYRKNHLVRFNDHRDKVSQKIGREDTSLDELPNFGLSEDDLAINANRELSLDYEEDGQSIQLSGGNLEEEVFSAFFRADIERDLPRALSDLDKRERRIVEGYYGIDREKETLKDMGIEYGITRERARQIKEEARRKLLAKLVEHAPGY